MRRWLLPRRETPTKQGKARRVHWVDERGRSACGHVGGPWHRYHFTGIIDGCKTCGRIYESCLRAEKRR